MEQNSTQQPQPAKPILVINESGSRSLGVLRSLFVIIGILLIVAAIAWYVNGGMNGTSLMEALMLFLIALISFLIAGLIKGIKDIVTASEIFIATQESHYDIRSL